MHECLECGYCYIAAEGAPLQGIIPGTPFADLPDDFTCPSCGAGIDAFAPPGPFRTGTA